MIDDDARRRRRAAARARVRGRRRLAVLIGVLLLGAGLLSGRLLSNRNDADSLTAERRPAPPKLSYLPTGGRRIFPEHRVVAFYGAPQSDELGALGIGSPTKAVGRLRRQARPYRRPGRPVLPALELIASVAAANPGADGMYRTRQSGAVIGRYLRAARRAKGLLILDVQPGLADFMTEVRGYERWLREPDVGLALDPEWHTPGAVPGTTIGSVDATKVNQVSAYLADIVARGRLPEKLFVIHQFTTDMIRNKPQVVKRPGLAVTFNVDGFGDQANKLAKYRQLTSEPVRFYNGYKLFYREDVDLMKPREVLRMRPAPDLIVYE